MYFKNILLCSFITALFASFLFSLYLEFNVTPIILAAETYEISETSPGTVSSWTPEDGPERSLLTFSANFLTAFAYALLLFSAITFRNTIFPAQGLLWGIAGYLSFFVAPALGLPPEIPGMEAAQLAHRQVWWLYTVFVTMTGLWLLVFGKPWKKAVSVVLLISPHLFGAPQPTIHGFSHPDTLAVEKLTELWHQFIIQTSIANALLWLIMGLASAILAARFIIPSDASN